MREKRRERPRRCVGAPLYSGICACRSSIRFFSVGQKNFLRQRRCCAILLRRFVLGRGRRYVERCPSWPKEHDWKSCMPQKGIWGSNPHLSARLIPRASSRLALIWRPFAGASPLRRGGRVVECGGLENRFTGAPGDEGSNPSSSAIFGSDILPYPGPFLSVYAGAGVVANAIRSTEPLFAAALPPIRHYSALCYGVCFC